jgi:hypothetical protein
MNYMKINLYVRNKKGNKLNKLIVQTKNQNELNELNKLY